ncbi:hypothetical protein N431DRAFT_475646 [Stipitochalara longipes BDJ]|nr:hypothetical protein N431DRAFT_475646 [Stipitochalara longipes BDJ]
MASPHSTPSAISYIPRAASHIDEGVGSSARNERIAVSPEILASTTRSNNIEPASVPLPVPNEAERAALSMHSGREDINIYNNGEEDALSISHEDEDVEDIASESHNLRSLLQQSSAGPASIEGRPCYEGGSVSLTPSISDLVAVSSPTVSTQDSLATAAEHIDTIVPEQTATNANTTSDNGAMETGSKEVRTQADNSRAKGLQKEWRPLSLNFGFLLVFLLFQAAVLAAVEIMYHYSATNTGLATITDHDSPSKTFVWAYFPITIALLIAVAWVSISSDTARITPWRMLSAKEGANSDVLFTKYLQDPFSTPFVSLRRLWRTHSSTDRLCSLAIFCSSLAHLLSFLVLPPLQASLMSVRELVTSHDTKYIQMPAFNASNPIHNEDRLGELYGRAYLAFQGLPIAKSARISGSLGLPVAVLPIASENPSMQYATFQASTTAYSSGLQCTTLNATQLVYIDSAKEQQLAQDNSMPNKTRINYSSLQYPISAVFSGLGTHGGCQFAINVPLGVGDDPTPADVNEWYYGGMDFLSATEIVTNISIDTSCNQWFYLNINYATLIYSPSNSTNFDFEVTFGEEPTFDAVSCQAMYYEVPNLKVDFLNTTTSPSFTYDSEAFANLSMPMPREAFNSTQFEEYQFLELESLKDNSSYVNTLPDGRPSTIQVSFQPWSFYFSTMKSPNINAWLNMGLTSGLPKWTDEYFQAAFTQRIDLSSDSWKSRPVNSFTLPASMPADRLVIDVVYARITEGILALLIFLTLAIMYINSRSKVNLYGNPNSIAAKCALIYDSPLFLSCFDRQNSKSPGQCRLHKLRGEVVQLEADNVISGLTESWNDNLFPIKTRIHFLIKKTYFHLGLLAFTIAVLVTVIVLWALAQKNGGLAQGSFNIHIDSVNQFAWTIVPVLAVILIKFFWGLVDDYFRLLQPYISLAGGSASARSSICVDYSSTMEKWLIVKASFRKHYVLAAVAALSLGNEVLVTAMGALFNSRSMNVIKPLAGMTNSSLWMPVSMMNFTDSSQIVPILQSFVPVNDIPGNTVNWFYPATITLTMVAWDAKPAPWTTEEYAFLPVFLNGSSNGISPYPEGTNWTVSTIGVRGSADCEALETPKKFFQPFPIVNDENVTVEIGLEIHDWQDGPETTGNPVPDFYIDSQLRLRNTVTFQGSMFRVPSSRTGVRARQGSAEGSLQGVMNYTGFWGPLWLANIDSTGDIELANISYPNSSISARDTNDQARTIWNLPEMKPGYFGAGFIDFSRIQEPETGIWYSTSPVASFVVCQPRFEYVNAQLILDGTSQSILEYKVNGNPSTLEYSQFLQTWHAADGSTPAEMGIGSAFTIASIFETDTTVFEMWFETDFFTDMSSEIASFSFSNLSEMVEPGNLKTATEAAFTSLFSQFAATPGYVFVPVNSSTLVTGGLVMTEMRIMISTTAMAIVVSMLSVMVIVLATLSYWTKWFLGLLHIIDKEPDTIGSEIALVYNSTNLLQLVARTEGKSNKERERFLEQQKKRFRIEKFPADGALVPPRIEVDDGTR